MWISFTTASAHTRHQAFDTVHHQLRTHTTWDTELYFQFAKEFTFLKPHTIKYFGTRAGSPSETNCLQSSPNQFEDSSVDQACMQSNIQMPVVHA